MSIWRTSGGVIIRDGTSGDIERCAECPCGGEPETTCEWCSGGFPDQVTVTISGWTVGIYAAELNGSYVLDFESGTNNCIWSGTFAKTGSSYCGRPNAVDLCSTGYTALPYSLNIAAFVADLGGGNFDWEVRLGCQLLASPASFPAYERDSDGVCSTASYPYTITTSGSTSYGYSTGNECSGNVVLPHMGAEPTIYTAAGSSDCSEASQVRPDEITLTI